MGAVVEICHETRSSGFHLKKLNADFDNACAAAAFAQLSWYAAIIEFEKPQPALLQCLALVVICKCAPRTRARVSIELMVILS